ncbi:MAG TPA: hypothetical protein VE641_00400 [Chthoniobacterales bacterium]|jgi:hypothetical protein|nr:hypothetical protein [Chthoniobacterales bacterium]
MADLIQFRSLTPHLLTAQTLGSDHFSPLFDLIKSMRWWLAALKVRSEWAAGKH